MAAYRASDCAKNLSRRSSLKSVGTSDLIGVHRIVLILIVDRESYNGRD